jgi:alkanesulfonate monooxygenase SsuD/methylene tetrahydromethanopterin reductase-like flavin-dependent oxidoreductase (luciferase family)
VTAAEASVRLGVGLWTMQSTRQAPAPFAALYRRFAEDAEAVERHGLDSLWLAEHRFWYDGWCPAPLHALAFAAARTERVRFGTAVMVAPQHDPAALARAALTAHRLSGGRLDLGLGLGHRAAEFDGLGISRADRGRRQETALRNVQEVCGRSIPVWIGGMAPAAIDRAARFGHGLLLPQSLAVEQAQRLLALYAERAGRPARFGVLRDVWLEDDRRAAAGFRTRLRRHYEEEVGSWWSFGAAMGFEDRLAVAGQLDRFDRCAAVGGADVVTEALAPWVELGAELVVARVNSDFVGQRALHEQLARLAREVVPALRAASVS